MITTMSTTTTEQWNTCQWMLLGAAISRLFKLLRSSADTTCTISTDPTWPTPFSVPLSEWQVLLACTGKASPKAAVTLPQLRQEGARGGVCSALTRGPQLLWDGHHLGDGGRQST